VVSDHCREARGVRIPKRTPLLLRPEHNLGCVLWLVCHQYNLMCRSSVGALAVRQYAIIIDEPLLIYSRLQSG
jgi:hypothetical protein